MSTLITFKPEAAYVEFLPDFAGTPALVIGSGTGHDTIYIEATDELLAQIHEAIGKHLAGQKEIAVK